MSVAVIGTGVIGLTTAVLLKERGYGVTMYGDGRPRASEAACAIWLPFLMGGRSDRGPEVEDRNEYTRWAEISWSYFSRIQGAHSGVIPVRLIETFSERQSRPFYANIVGDFRERMFSEGPEDLTYCWTLNTYIIEMPIYLDYLKDRIESLGIKIVKQHIETEDLEKLGDGVVFNCSGLGAKELVGDVSIRPIKGQLLLLEPKDIGTSIGAGEFCVIPRRDALVVGSLFLEDDQTDLENKEGSGWLMEEYGKWVNTPFGKELGLVTIGPGSIKSIQTGLRPYREEGVRLEREDRGNTVLFHNYGHGGGGVTFSWGTSVVSVAQYEQSAKARLFNINTNRIQRRCGVSIEIAHIEPDALDNIDDRRIDYIVKHSNDIANNISDVLNQNNIEYNKVILIDDKNMGENKRNEVVRRLSNKLHGIGIDYLCLESKLELAAGYLVDHLSDKDKKEFERYRLSHGRLACSQDITIWYALRLGLLNIDTRRWKRILTPVSRGAVKGERPFIADIVVSVLESAYKQFESIAVETLRRTFGPEVSSVCSAVYFD